MLVDMIVLLESDWVDAPVELQEILKSVMNLDLSHAPDYVFLADFTDVDELKLQYQLQVKPKNVMAKYIKFLPEKLHYLFEGKDVFSQNMFTALVAWY